MKFRKCLRALTVLIILSFSACVGGTGGTGIDSFPRGGGTGGTGVGGPKGFGGNTSGTGIGTNRQEYGKSDYRRRDSKSDSQIVSSRIEGRLLNHSGQPMPAVTVSLELDSIRMKAVTDKGGVFYLVYPANTRSFPTLRFKGPGINTVRALGRESRAEVNRLDFQLQKAGGVAVSTRP